MTNVMSLAIRYSNLDSKEGYVGVGEPKDPNSWKINELHSCCCPLYHL